MRESPSVAIFHQDKVFLILVGALALTFFRMGDQQSESVAITWFPKEVHEGVGWETPRFQGEMEQRGWLWEFHTTSLVWEEDLPLRAHALTLQEADNLSWAQTEARFLRAVRERTIEVIVLRPQQATKEKISSLTRALERRGRSVSVASTDMLSLLEGWPPPPPKRWGGVGSFQIALLLGALSFLSFLHLLAMWGVPKKAIGWSVLAGILYGFFRGGEGGLWSVASVGVLSAGGVGIAFLVSKEEIWRPLAGAVLSGLVAGGLLWIWAPYKVGLISPVGIKAGLVLPVLGGLWWGWKAWKPGKKAISCLLWGMGSILLLSGIALWASERAGDTGWLFPGELAFRDFLESHFPARPRTRELLGYPATALLLVRRWKPGFRLFLSGLFLTALVTTQNTFLHSTTPLTHNLLREGLGLLLGLGLPYGVIKGLWRTPLKGVVG